MDYLFVSKRLGFRNWKPKDLSPFSKLNADEKVMRYFPFRLSVEQTQTFMDRLNREFEQNGYTFFAVEVLESREFIGFIGFENATLPSGEPCVEIAWRLHPKFWNKGLATEGALRCLEYASTLPQLEIIYAWTAKINGASERIMSKIGMEKIAEFQHQKLPIDHELSNHVLYRKRIK